MGTQQTVTLVGTERGSAEARPPLQGLPLAHLQLLGCELIIFAYFLAMWQYKTWFVATAIASAITALTIVLGSLRRRGLVRDLWPIVLYFVYLAAASTQAEYSGEALYWSLVDSIGILVAALFWLAARNNTPGPIRDTFIRLTFLAALVTVALYRAFPDASRLGGYSLPFLAIFIPFLWAEVMTGNRRRLALVALLVALTILFLSRSRTPLAAGLLALSLSFFFIGRNLRQRIKVGLMLAALALVIGLLLMSFGRTRYALLVFVARVTHKDIVTSDVYVQGEPFDPTRSNLDDIVKTRIVEVQPFGIGYTTVGRYYERAWGIYTPLHSMYQTWIFEGGFFCALIVLVILIRHALALRRSVRRARNEQDAVMARCLIFATVSALFIGVFHQMHQGPLLFAVLGMTLGFRQRVCAGEGR